MKIKGLPYQTVQFQFIASAMRSYAEDSILSAEDKLVSIQKIREQLIQMAEANADFWSAQCKDGEFYKRS